MPLLAATRRGLFRVVGENQPTAFGHDGPEFLALARSPSSPGVCYAAELNGQVYRSDDRGERWEAVGQTEGFRELSSLAVDPRDPDHLLAGMESAGLLISRDGGRSWDEDPAIRRMSQENGWSVPWSDAKGHVRTIAIDPNDPGRIYLAIEVGGVVRSDDGGESWENVRGGIHDDVHSVGVCPHDGSVVYAATRHGFGRSDDHGRSWRRLAGFDGQGYARPLALDSRRPERVYTAAAPVGPGDFDRPEVGAECGVFRSDDGGQSWERLTNGLPARFRAYVDGLDVDPADPDHVAVADSDGHLYESRDGGQSWRQTHALPPTRRLLFTG